MIGTLSAPLLTREGGAGDFIVPNKTWTHPYPYCSGDVLFLVEYLQVENKIEKVPGHSASVLEMEEQEFSKDLLANDSLGGKKN